MREEDGNPTKLVYRVMQVPQMAPAYSAIVGDAFGNMRSALDHLAWRVVELDGGIPNRQTKFPIYDDRFDNNGNPRHVTISPQITRPDILSALEAIQPYQRPDPTGEVLSVVNSLRNVDEHRMLLVMVHGLNIDDAAPVWGLPANCPSPTFRANLEPLQSGDPVAWFDFRGTLAPAEFEPRIRVAVTLGEGPPGCWLRTQSLVGMLHGLIHTLTVEINHRFVPLFNAGGTFEPEVPYPAAL